MTPTHRYMFTYDDALYTCTVTAVWRDDNRLRATIESRTASDDSNIVTVNVERELCKWVALPDWHPTGPDGQPGNAHLGPTAARALEAAVTTAGLPSRCEHLHQ